MEGWAKGLKDRAERAANQLSQVSTAFMPPEDGSGGQLEGDPLPTNGDSCREEQANDDLSPTAGGAADMTNGGYAGTASRRDVIQKATNEELMSLLKRQSARLKSVEAEHGTLKEKYIATFEDCSNMQRMVQELEAAKNQSTSGADDGEALERLTAERNEAVERLKNVTERYKAKHESFRALAVALTGERDIDDASVLEKIQSLLKYHRESRGIVATLQEQVKGLQAKVATAETDGDGGGVGSRGGAEAFGATIAALQDRLREVSQAKDKAERMVAAADGGGGKGGGEDWDLREKRYQEALSENETKNAELEQNLRRTMGVIRALRQEKHSSVDQIEGLKTQLAQSKADNSQRTSELEELAQQHRSLQAQTVEMRNAAVDSGVAAGLIDEIEELKMQLAQAKAIASDSTNGHRLREAERELAAANEKAAALSTRCLEAETTLDSATNSLNDARQRLAKFESSVAVAAAAAASSHEEGRVDKLSAECGVLQERVNSLTEDKEEILGKLATRTADMDTWMDRTNQLMTHARDLEALAETSQSELTAAKLREEQHLGHASTMQKSLDDAAQVAAAAAMRMAELEASMVVAGQDRKAAVAEVEAATERRVAQLEDKLVAVEKDGREQLTALEEEVQRATEAQERYAAETVAAVCSLREAQAQAESHAEESRQLGQAWKLVAQELEGEKSERQEVEQALVDELKTLRRGTTELSETLEEYKVRESQARAAADGLADRPVRDKELEERVDAPEREMVAAREATDSSPEEAANFASRLSELEADLQRQREVAVEYQAAEESTRAETEQVRVRLQEVETELQDKIAELVESEARRDNTATAADEEVCGLRTRASSLEAAVTEHRAATDHAKESAARAVRELEEVRVECADATQTARAQTAEAMEQFDSASQKLQEIKVEAKRLDEARRTLLEEKETFQQENARLLSNLRATEQELTAAETAAVLRDQELATAQQTMSHAQAKLSEAMQAAETNVVEAERVKAVEMDELSAEVLALQAQLSEALAASLAAEGSAAEATAEVASLRTEVEELKGQLATAETSIAEALSKVDLSVAASREEGKAKEDELQQQLATARVAIEANDQRVMELHEGRVAVERMLEGQLKEHTMEARIQTADLRAEKDAVEEELQQLGDTHAGLVALTRELETTSDAAAARAVELEQQLQVSEEALREAEARYEEVAAAAAAREGEIGVAQSTTDQLRDQLEKSHATARAAEQSVEKLTNEVGAARVAVDEVREQVVMAEQRAGDAEGTVAEMRLELARVTAAGEEAKAGAQRLAIQLQASTQGVSEQLATLEAQCAEAQEARATAEANALSWQERVLKLDKKESELVEHLSKVEANRDEARTAGEVKAEDLQHERGRTKEELQAARSAVDETQAETSRVRVELEATMKAMVDVRSETERLSSELNIAREGAAVESAALRHELSAAREEVTAAKAAVEEAQRAANSGNARAEEVSFKAEEARLVYESRITDLSKLLTQVEEELSQAKSRLELLSAHVESSKDEASAQVEIFRSQATSAEEARAAAEMHTRSSEEELSQPNAAFERFRSEAADAADAAARVAAEQIAEAATKARTAAQEAQENVARLTVELEAVNEEINAGEAALAEARAEASRLCRELDASLTALKSAETSKDSISALLTDATAAAAAAEEARVASELRLAQFLEEGKRTVDEAEQANAHTAAAEAISTELAELEQRLNVAEGDHEAAKEELATAGEAGTALEKEARELRDLVEVLKAELRATAERGLLAEAAAEELRAELQATAERGLLVETAADEFRAEVQATAERGLAGERGAKRGMRVAQEETRAAEEAEIGALRQALSAVEGDKAKLTASYNAAIDQVQDIQEQLVAMTSERDASVDVVGTREKELAAAQAHARELEVEVETVQVNEQVATERAEKMSSKLTQLVARCKDIRASANKQQAAADALLEQTALKSAEEISALQREYDMAQEELGATRSVVDAADGRVMALTEEIESLRRARDRLEGRRMELQLELAAEKLAGTVLGGDRRGVTAWRAARGGKEASFVQWKMACIDARQKKLGLEAELLAHKAENYEGLVKRLSEELEQQGAVVNRHADVLHEKDLEVQRALERASRAQQELITMEPPTLAQADDGLEVLLRVSSTDAAAVAEEASMVGADESGVIGEAVASCSAAEAAVGPRVWCLVRYHRKPLGTTLPRGGANRDDDASEERSGKEHDVASAERGQENANSVAVAVAGRDGDRVGGDEECGQGIAEVQGEHAAAGDDGVDRGCDTSPNKPAFTSSSRVEAAEGDDHEAPAPAASVVAGDTEGETGKDGEVTLEEGEDERRHPGNAPASTIIEETSQGAAATGATPEAINVDEVQQQQQQQQEVVVEWRLQEEVDEWFARQVAQAVESSSTVENTAYGGEAAGALGDLMEAVPTPAPAAPEAKPPTLPMLDMPMTVQERFAVELRRLRDDREGQLEEARAELSRNTEAYQQYRARAHTTINTTIKKSADTQRALEARIAQCQAELATAREEFRRTREEGASAEVRWGQEAATLAQRIQDLEALVEAEQIRAAEVEAGVARSVEQGLHAAREEVAVVQQRLEAETAALEATRRTLSSARTELEKNKREMIQIRQRARTLIAEKDVILNRLTSGGGGENGSEASATAAAAAGRSTMDTGSSTHGAGNVIAANGHPALSPGLTPGGFTHGDGSPSVAAAVSGVPPPVGPDGGSSSGTAGGGGRGISGGGGGGGSGMGEGSGDGVVGVAGGNAMVDSHHAEQQILQMARVQAQRDEETGRLRQKIQKLLEEISKRDRRLSARDDEKIELRRRVEELRGEAKRARELLDAEHGSQKLTYLKNVVIGFITSKVIQERKALVAVLAEILSFTEEEKAEVNLAVETAARVGKSSWWG